LLRVSSTDLLPRRYSSPNRRNGSRQQAVRGAWTAICISLSAGREDRRVTRLSQPDRPHCLLTMPTDPNDASSSHSVRSFTRMTGTDVNPQAPPRARTATEQAESSAAPLSLPVEQEEKVTSPDVFERRSSADSSVAADGQADEGFVLSRSVQNPSEELPIELISLTDRCALLYPYD
jgi:hypothetical protein